jgi:hypothetical protein
MGNQRLIQKRREFFRTAGSLLAILPKSMSQENLRTANTPTLDSLYRSSLPWRGQCVLDEASLPVLGWPGPSGEMITDKIMRDMSEGGFNLSLSSTTPDRIVSALDIAHNNGMRLILQSGEYAVSDKFVLDEPRKTAIRDFVRKIKDHPGLYGYHLRDEPRFFLIDTLAKVADFIRDLDPYHLCYINHNPPVSQDGLGAGSVELFWKGYIQRCRPRFLSYDHYPIQIGSDEEIRNLGPNAPNVFGKVVVKPDYFEALDGCRTFSTFYGIPFWVFTCSVRHGQYPAPTEGYMRFQLNCNLAYGARGLQYFTYAYAQAMVRRDGTTTPEWEIARQINADIHKLWLKMKNLRSIGVYHTGPTWYGTRSLPRSSNPGTINCTGDPAVLGIFDDQDGMKYVYLVNRNPVSWARMQLEANVKEGEDLVYYELEDGQFYRRWPYRIKNLPLALAPGEAILFRLGGTGPGRF